MRLPNLPATAPASLKLHADTLLIQQYVVPLIAIVAGMVLLDEKLQFGIAVGGILILIGVVLTDRADTQRSRSE